MRRILFGLLMVAMGFAVFAVSGGSPSGLESKLTTQDTVHSCSNCDDWGSGGG